MIPCEHASAELTTMYGCEVCSARRSEREAILSLIEETSKAWTDSTRSQLLIEVILARIRARK